MPSVDELKRLMGVLRGVIRDDGLLFGYTLGNEGKAKFDRLKRLTLAEEEYMDIIGKEFTVEDFRTLRGSGTGRKFHGFFLAKPR